MVTPSEEKEEKKEAPEANCYPLLISIRLKNRTSLQGDSVVFYLGSPVATAHMLH